MQALVKTPHIEINIHGNKIPQKILNFLEKEYGNKLKLINEEDEVVDIFTTDWYKEIDNSMTPGNSLKNYRELNKFTQTELGERLGNTPRQHISNMEKGIRSISKETAKKLAKIFKVPVGRFI